MKQIYPATITGKSFAPGGSVLDHNFGKGEPYTLGVEEEYMANLLQVGCGNRLGRRQRPSHRQVTVLRQNACEGS